MNLVYNYYAKVYLTENPRDIIFAENHCNWVYLILSEMAIGSPMVRAAQFMSQGCFSPPVKISEDHPRYRSLMTRELMASMVERGIVSMTGLIAHGRGEAFDYLLGERTVPEAEASEAAAAALMSLAHRPVITINGNAAALASKELGELAIVCKAPLEVNLFHRTDERMNKVCDHVERETGQKVLGRVQDATLPGIASDRSRCTSDGLLAADVVLIPLEDGDRAEAMVKVGKKVISIDLNPLSRTTLAADVAVVDEVTRAVPNMIVWAKRFMQRPEEARAVLEAFDNKKNLAAIMGRICEGLEGSLE